MHLSEPFGRALKAANREARRLGQPAVTTGYLLRALLCDEACAACGLLRGAWNEAMRSLLSLDSARRDFETEEPVGSLGAIGVAIDERRIDELIRSGRALRLAHDPDRLPQTAALKRSIELAIEEARRIGPSREPLAGGAAVADVGTEHLLLGLLAVVDGVAGRVLERMGVDATGVRQQISAAPMGAEGRLSRPPGSEEDGS
jgi:hypothetical protein